MTLECYGLVQSLYKDAGYIFPETAEDKDWTPEAVEEELINNYGAMRISTIDALDYDLLILNIGGKAHLGVFWRDGLFFHYAKARSVASDFTGYWRRHLYSVLRLKKK